MTVNAKTEKLGPFSKGMDNRLADFALSDEDGKLLRSAVNVDIDARSIARRPGYQKVRSFTDGHSFYADGDVAFWVDGTTLYRATGTSGGLSVASVQTGLSTGARMSYAEVGQEVWYSNGYQKGRVKAGTTTALPWGVPVPSADPSVTATPDVGTLPDGIYQAIYTFVNAAGEESGASRIAYAQLINSVPSNLPTGGNRYAEIGGKIVIGGLPTSLPTGVDGVNVYMTEPGGDQFMLIASLDSSTLTATLDVAVIPQYGPRCTTVFLGQMPAGQIVRYSMGRLLVALGNAIFYSEPFALGLHDPAKNFVLFDDEVVMVQNIEGGVYVATEKATYYLEGDITTAVLRQVLPYGAVKYSGAPIPHKNQCFWMSDRGVVVGSESGQVENIQEEHVATNPAAAGASLYREFEGLKSSINTLFGEEQSNTAVGTFMDAEIIRKEERL